MLSWYQAEYDFACQQILLDRDGNTPIVIIDNQLFNEEREEGVFLNHELMVASDEVIESYSTSRAFAASPQLVERIGDAWPDKKTTIGNFLFPELFQFKRKMDDMVASGLLNRNLIDHMPSIISSQSPALAAAQVNSQMEFDRTFRTIVKEKAYRNKKVAFISGIHVDISPREDQLFPLTKFVPWAAYIQKENGEGYTLEQRELYEALHAQSAENPHKIDLTAAIHQMEAEPEIHLNVDHKK